MKRVSFRYQVSGPGMADQSIFLEKPTITFKDVCGLQEIKEVFIERILLPLKFPALFKNTRALLNKCMLVFGAPGAGKSLIVRSLAAELPVVSFYRVLYHDMVLVWRSHRSNSDVARSVGELFSEARAHQPCIIVMDEIESFNPSSPHGNELLMFSEINRQIQDLRGTDIYVVFITQRPQDFPSVLRRRSCPRVYIPLPDHKARCEMVKMNLLNEKNIKSTLTEDDVQEIAVHTNGFTGADISTLCRSALMQPIRELRHAQFYKKVEVTKEGQTSTKYKPCDPDDPCALKMTWEDMECADDLDEPPVTMDHVRKVLRSSRPSVTEEDLKVYHEFIKTCGNEDFFLPVKHVGAELLQVQCKRRIQKALTLDRMDGVMDLPLPRRLKLFLLATDDKEGNPRWRLPVKTDPGKDDEQSKDSENDT